MTGLLATLMAVVLSVTIPMSCMPGSDGADGNRWRSQLS